MDLDLDSSFVFVHALNLYSFFFWVGFEDMNINVKNDEYVSFWV